MHQLAAGALFFRIYKFWKFARPLAEGVLDVRLPIHLFNSPLPYIPSPGGAQGLTMGGPNRRHPSPRRSYWRLHLKLF